VSTGPPGTYAPRCGYVEEVLPTGRERATMLPMDRAPKDPGPEVASFEARLRRNAGGRIGEASDPELADILGLIGTRRTRRTRPGRSILDDRPAPGVEAPATGPAPTAETTVAEPEPVHEAPIGAQRPTSGAPTTRDRNLSGPAGRVIEVERVGPSVAILRFGRPAGFTFTAGQYMRVGLTNVRQGKFTISSAPHDSYLEICVESIPGGRLTPRLVTLGPGAVLDSSDTAKGGFVLDRSGSTHVMVATGTGIAPFISMLRDALHRGVRDSFVILHGASYSDDLPYLDELTALAQSDARVEYIPTVSRPGEARNAAWTGRTGRVDTLAREMLPTLAGPATRIYACGNSGMVSAVTSAMKASGLKVMSETFD